MKKIILPLSLLLLSGTSQAQPAQELALIKQMYQIDRKTQQGNQTLNQFADRELQRAFALIPDGELCGVDHDVLWQSQDPDYQARLTFTPESKGRVKVKIGTTGSVTYALFCKNSVCKITDAFDAGQYSVKKSLIDECS